MTDLRQLPIAQLRILLFSTPYLPLWATRRRQVEFEYMRRVKARRF